jgi:hypothetical protein
MVLTNEEWFCYPAYHGLAIVRPSDHARPSPFEGLTVQTFLPTFDGYAEDRVLPGELPLSLRLTNAEYGLLTARTHGLAVAAAGTIYGPKNQDKRTNEDFAVSAVLQDENGEGWAFAAVADGVSTKTFWAARTSRIACLVAFREIRQHIRCAEPFSTEAMESLRQSLCASLRKALEAERSFLREARAVPPGQSKENYSRYLDRDELWFNSTLLIGCLGETGGLVVWAGDGGICLRKTPQSSSMPSVDNMVLQSREESTINSFVSLNVKSTDFQVARVQYDAFAAIDLYLSSDGVDRTLQRNPEQDYPSLTIESGVDARAVLEKLAQLPHVEQDNFSIAHLGRSISAVGTPGTGRPAPRRTPVESEGPSGTQKLPNVPPKGPVTDLREPVRKPSMANSSTKAPRRPWLSTVTHCAAFLVGVAVATSYLAVHLKLLTATSNALERVIMLPLARPRGRAPATTPPTVDLQALPPVFVVLHGSVGKDTAESRPTGDIKGYVTQAVKAIQTDHGSIYSVVAYADRQHLSPPSDCEVNKSTSLKRSTYVAKLIAEALRGMNIKALVESHQNVCQTPPGVPSIASEEARRLVLVRGSVADCKCE